MAAVANINRYFSSLEKRYQRNIDDAAERGAKKDELMAEYMSGGDFYDAIGSARNADEKANQLWEARNRLDFAAMLRIMDEIMGDAAENYAETRLLEAEEQAEESAAMARARRCGRVPAGYDD